MTGGIFAVLERTGKELIEIVFTLHPSLATPDKQGVWRGEEVLQLFTTLHPLFLSGQEGTDLSAHRTQAEIGGLVIGFAGFLLYG